LDNALGKIQGLDMRLGKFKDALLGQRAERVTDFEDRFVGDELGRDQLSSMTIDDVVERLTEDSLIRLLEQIPPPLREKHQTAWDILIALIKRIQSTSRLGLMQRGTWDQVLPPGINYRELAADRPLLFDRLLDDLWFNDNDNDNQLQNSWQSDPELDEMLETVKAVSTVFKHYSIFVKEAADSSSMRFSSQLRSRLHNT
jgi:hypothetical protein